VIERKESFSSKMENLMGESAPKRCHFFQVQKKGEQKKVFTAFKKVK